MADIFTSGAASPEQAALFGGSAGTENSTGTPTSIASSFSSSSGGLSTGGYLGAAGDLFNGIGQAVGGYFAYEGAKKQSELYGEAAQLAGENATEEEGLTQLKEVQQRRQISMVLGTQQADVGANNFAGSGTALDLLKSSQQQGALAVTMTGIQGEINVQAFQRQQQADLAMQQQAKNAEGAGIASGIGGIFKAVEAVAPIALALL